MPLISSVMRQSVSNFRLYCCLKKLQMLQKKVKSLLEQLQVCIFMEILFGVRCTLSFLSTLNGCCDASEINILVNIFKKNQLSILNNLYAVLNFSRLMTNVYGSANINKERIKYHHVYFLILSTMQS